MDDVEYHAHKGDPRWDAIKPPSKDERALVVSAPSSPGLSFIYERFMNDIAGTFRVPLTRLRGGASDGGADMIAFYRTVEEKMARVARPITRIKAVLYFLGRRKRNKRRPKFACAYYRRRG